MQNPDSEELKARLKGKSPEEIAEIVGRYYETQYEKEKLFAGKKYLYGTLSLIIFILLLAFALWIFSSLSSLRPDSTYEQPGRTFPDPLGQNK